MNSFRSSLVNLIRQPSLRLALILWILISVAAIVLCHGTMPLAIGPHPDQPAVMVISSSVALVFLVQEAGLVALITRWRAIPDLAARAPQRSVALRETACMWIYAAIVLLVGRWLGLHFFHEGIAMHLNGSLVGATRAQSPAEVYTWASYNFFFLALVPYLVFRMLVVLRPESCPNIKGFPSEQKVRRHFHLLHHGRSTHSVGMWTRPPAICEAATGIFLGPAWGLYDSIKRDKFKHINFSHAHS